MNAKTWTVALVLAAAATADAQPRTRTAQPTDPPARQSEVESLRRQVQALMERVKALEAEVASLRSGKPATNVATGADRPGAAPDPRAAISRAIDQGRLVKGMTERDAIEAMKKPPTATEGEADSRVLRWEFYEGSQAAVVTSPGSTSFRGGPATGGRQGTLVRRVAARFEDGTLVDFSDDKAR